MGDGSGVLCTVFKFTSFVSYTQTSTHVFEADSFRKYMVISLHTGIIYK